MRGGSGKTLLSIGIIAAWRALGKIIAPFKKGPDYIDAGWLALAAGRPCYNLDTFLIEPQLILQSFLSHTSDGDIAVIEGNRGLYDGIDMAGSTSTAELTKLLDAPVILSIDCTKSTRTMAAAVLGCLHFDPDVQIKGVILNRVAGSRHENILRRSIEHHCGIPVLGAVPKLDKENFPERHMGLTTTLEHGQARESVAAASQVGTQHLDLNALADIAHSASQIGPVVENQASQVSGKQPVTVNQKSTPKIGVVRDSAFQFYYPENIEALIAAGAEPVFLSPFSDHRLPGIDGLYIGGGFPETHAQELSNNHQFRTELKSLAEDGLPIYAECGGLMYLGEELVMEGKAYPMAGVLPVVFGFSQKPQGHGYTIVVVDGENPYFAVGTEFRGHEFHYSHVLQWRGDDGDLVYTMKRGTGFTKRKDGVCYKNVLATYTHLHALGTPGWAHAMVRNAIAYRNSKH
jgi:cobyrinic acid a,c-diamide synthase